MPTRVTSVEDDVRPYCTMVCPLQHVVRKVQLLGQIVFARIPVRLLG
jgi:hypothetical protein